MMKKMKSTISRGLLSSMVAFALLAPYVSVAEDSDVDLATKAKITASSCLNDSSKPENVAAGKKTNECRWISEKGNGPHYLTLDFGKEQTIKKINASFGTFQGRGLLYTAHNFVFQKWENGAWVDIPETKKEGNKDFDVSFKFPNGIKTSKIRLQCNDVIVRVFAISVY